MITSEKQDAEFSRDELLETMRNFSTLSCETCGTKGNWTCFKIYINNLDNVREQFKINIFKENGEIWGGAEEGMFSLAEIEMSIMLVQDRIKEESFSSYPSKLKGSAFIMVDFLIEEPYNRVSVFDLDGITVDEVSRFIDAIVE
jgi:hypothetical protein